MFTNPLKLNIQLPTARKNHLGQSKPLSQGDIIGMKIMIDMNPNAIDVSFVGTTFGLDALQAYADLTPGDHTLSVAVVTKFGVGKFTAPEPFTIVDGQVDAPVISFV